MKPPTLTMDAVIIGKVDLNDKRGGTRKRPASPRALPPFPALEKMVERVANKMLDAAKTALPGESRGQVRREANGRTVIVTWDRPAGRYVVGTAAEVVASGGRAEVLPALVALLRGAP